MAPRRENNKESSSDSKRSRTKTEKSNDSLESDDDDEYRKKRDRNNQAVKRSRVKSKLKTQETMNRVSQLKNENSALEEKVKTLTKELSFLKELFLAHASNSTGKLEGVDLERLLSDESMGTSSSTNEKKRP